jgi:uncharacterized protein YecE (DUF72 family)
MSLLFGTCSWKFPAWVGLVYRAEQRYAADYLPEYARSFPTAEIDSWFYHLPARQEAESYRERVPEDFHFTCKVPRELTLTHLRGGAGGNRERPPNASFLSLPLFHQFLEAIEPLRPQIDALMFQFEYLNKQKMSGLSEFIDRFGAFAEQLSPQLPLALEIRNGNYLKPEYFRFLAAAGIIPVLVEKQYMPPLPAVWRDFGRLLEGPAVVRLMGGDRKEIEEHSGGRWNRLWMPKENLPEIADTLGQMGLRRQVTVNVNNHYEGSAPLTIGRLESLVERS